MEFRKTNRVLIVIFILLLVLPVLAMNTKKDAASQMDNRNLAESPIAAAKKGGDFTKAVDSYMNDRIGFRSTLIGLNNRMDYFVFQKSPVSSVVLGKEGWLFLSTGERTDEITTKQYIGNYKYSEKELRQIADNLVTTEKYLKARNCEFVLYIAPNKERMYSEYMPDAMQAARVSETCNTEQLIDYLRKNTDIRIVWPYEDLREYQRENPEIPLYYHLDTHWNQLGGYIGARALLSELGVEIPAPELADFTESHMNAGDLTNMMAVGATPNLTDTEYSPLQFPTKDTKINEESFNGHWRYSNTNKDPRKLLMCRDSFCTAMRNEIGSSFNSVDLCHHESFTQNLVEEEKPDLFVYQLVERRDNELLKFRMEE